MELLSRRCARHRTHLVIGAVLVQVALFPWPISGSGGQVDEYDLKAAFVLNFTRFVEWPPDADATNVVICVVGDDPFGATLDRLASKESVKERSLEVRRLEDPAEGNGCHIAFVRSAEREKALLLLNQVGGAPVLTIGETRDFTERGGIICLPIERGRVKVVINAAAASRARLRISAKLLSLAQLVSGTPSKD